MYVVGKHVILHYVSQTHIYNSYELDKNRK